MPAADTLRDTEYQGVYVLINMLLYAVTLYANFTGGIDITIGSAEMMGIRMEENFDRPFYATNIADYWRRWHITMGSWFKDYLFYPMSVSKPMLNLSKRLRERFGSGLGKRAPVYIVTIVLWFMTGLWHGATWNFIVWGLVNGVIILISQELSPLYARFHKHFKFADTKCWDAFQILRTFLLMSAIRMFDRYDGVGTTFKMLGSVFTRFDLRGFVAADITELGVSIPGYIGAGLGVCLLIFVSFLGRGRVDAREKLFNLKWPLRYAVVGALFFMIVVFGAYGIGYDAAQFIYNQF
jgi:D-alanyl-lipoteichoic acid acyltransferase DltB (MBOAT superfamily)